MVRGEGQKKFFHNFHKMSKKIILIVVITVFLHGGITNNIFAAQPAPSAPVCEFSGRIVDTLSRSMTSTMEVSKIEAFVIEIEKMGNLISRGDNDAFPQVDCNELEGKMVNRWIADQYTDSTYTVKRYSLNNFKIGIKISGYITLGDSNIRNLKFASNEQKNDSLVEGNIYTIKELNSNTSSIPRKFFAEGYVVYVYSCPPCDGGVFCSPCRKPFIILSENKNYDYSMGNNLGREEILVENESPNYSNLELTRKYQFEVSAQNNSNTNIIKNEFTLVSVTNIDGSVVISETTIPLITDQPVKRSFFGRIWNWFARLFKR